MAAEVEKSKGGAAVKERPSEAQATAQGEAKDLPPEVMQAVQQMALGQGQSPPQ